jgi:proteasome lid subunit RPN8/RPN11
MVASLDPASRSDAEQHARQHAPSEACGLIVLSDGRQSYWPCGNLCDEPEQHFIMDPRDYCKAAMSGTIAAIVHSHPNGVDPSGLDRKACTQSGLPWFIYQVPQNRWLTINP